MIKRKKQRAQQNKKPTLKIGIGLKFVDTVALLRQEQIIEGRKMMLIENLEAIRLEK